MALLALVMSATASAADRERASMRIGDDVFVAGDRAVLRHDVAGDALLAGGEVELAGAVGGDAVLAGGRVELDGRVEEDLYAAAGELVIRGNVGGSARITAGEIDLHQDASIGDGASIAGGRIELDGRIGRYAQIAGGSVRLNGRVDGDVTVRSGELAVGPDAIIEGRLIYRGDREARVSPSAQVRGGVASVASSDDERRFAKRVFRWFSVAWLIGWVLVGIVLLALLPGATRAVTDTVRARPGASLLVGLALIIALPILIVIVAITIIGLPLALLLAALYVVLLPLGYLAAVAALGDWLAPRLRRAKPVTTLVRLGAFVLALTAVYLVTRVPVLGGVLICALILVGMGALALAMRRRGPPPPAAAQA